MHLETHPGKIYRAFKETLRDLRRGYTDQALIGTYRRAFGLINPEDIAKFRIEEGFRAGLIFGVGTNYYTEEMESIRAASDEQLAPKVQLAARQRLERWGLKD